MNSVNEYQVDLIRRICDHKKLKNVESLITKFSQRFTSKSAVGSPPSVVEAPNKRAPNKEHPHITRCCANVGVDKRCSRPRKTEYYCGSHSKEGSLKHGVISNMQGQDELCKEKLSPQKISAGFKQPIINTSHPLLKATFKPPAILLPMHKA